MSSRLIQFKQWSCWLVYTNYADTWHATCIYLVDADTGEIVLTATVNIPDYVIYGTRVLIKDWGENHGILKVLEEAGIVKWAGLMVPTGYMLAHECELLVSAEEYEKLPYPQEVE